MTIFDFFGGNALKVSDRLKTIVSCAEKCCFLVDVGTDHAYVPICLVKNKIAERAVACDISKGSVEKAEKNIRFYGYSDFIEARFGYGLEVINENESPDQIIIAGMGGMLTIEILEASESVVSRAQRIILQPQRDIFKVRKCVHSLGFKIVDEKMLFEDGKYYNIIVCEKGPDSFYTERDYFFGKILIQSKNKFLINQADFELSKIKKILCDMKYEILNGKNDEVFLERFEELQKKEDLYKSIVF